MKYIFIVSVLLFIILSINFLNGLYNAGYADGYYSGVDSGFKRGLEEYKWEEYMMRDTIGGIRWKYFDRNPHFEDEMRKK